jgi:hypothetical protein
MFLVKAELVNLLCKNLRVQSTHNLIEKWILCCNLSAELKKLFLLSFPFYCSHANKIDFCFLNKKASSNDSEIFPHKANERTKQRQWKLENFAKPLWKFIDIFLPPRVKSMNWKHKKAYYFLFASSAFTSTQKGKR